MMKSLWSARSRVMVVVVCLASGPSEVLAKQALGGRATQVRDGDLLVVEGSARVRIIRRHEAQVQTVYNPAERWLIVMIDHVLPGGKAGDGGTDRNYTFHDVAEWPLGERWSGYAVVDEYSIAGAMPTHGIALTTDTRTIQVLGSTAASLFRDPDVPTQVSFRGMGAGSGGGEPFTIAAGRLSAQASRNAQSRSKLPGGGPEVSSSLEMQVGGEPTGSATTGTGPPSSQAPVRVGGNVRTPRKIVDVAPVMPEAARAARVAGMVIVEATIGAEGAVVDAKILRSIPLLNEAALDAVRQWRFEPTYLNGEPVPVIMTVTVNFRPDDTAAK